MGNKTTWDGIAAAGVSEKVFLAEIEPAQEVSTWILAPDQTNTYEAIFINETVTLANGKTTNVKKEISKIEEDSTALTERASVALVEANAGSYFHDTAKKDPLDFTGFVESDVSGRLTMTANNISILLADRDETFHVSKDYGVGYFADFYEHRVDVLLSNIVDTFTYAGFGCYFLANSADDAKAIKDASGDGLLIWLQAWTGNTYKIQLVNITGGSSLTVAESVAISTSDISYLSISRVGTTCTIQVYSADSLRLAGTVGDVDTLSGTVVGTAYSHIYGITSYNRGATPYRVNGSVGNLKIDIGEGTLYVHPTGSDDPNDHTMLAFFWLYFATQGIELNSKYYEPYIGKKGIPTISQSVESIFYGISVISAGNLQMLNQSGFFDQILDAFIWINKKVKLFAGGDSLPYSEYLQIYTGLITSKKYSRREIPFTLKSSLNPLLRDIPINNYWTFNFPNLDPQAEGKVMPYYYGVYSKLQAPEATCIDTAYAGSLVQFQFGDPAVGSIGSITQVYVNYFAGAGWEAIAHGNEDLTNSRFTISDTNFIVGTTKVKVAFSGIDDGAVIEKAPYIVEHLLTTILGYTAADLNTASFTASKAESEAQLNVPIESVTSALKIIEKICKSDLAFFDEDLNGKFRYRTWAPVATSTAEIIDEKDFIDNVPEVKFDQKDAYYKINVGYSYSFETRTYLYQEKTNLPTLYKYGKNDPLQHDTYLRGSSDALVLAQRMAFILEQPSGQLKTTLKMQHMDLLVGDVLKVNMIRAPFATSGGYSERVFEIINTNKKCFPVKNVLTLRDLAGYGSSIGTWTAATIPAWGSASLQEKEDSGWWVDANGFASPGDQTSKNQSKWW